MELKSSKLAKNGYKWMKVSEMFNETPPVTASCEINKRFPGYEGLWCKLIMAITSYAMTKNSVAVIHGPTNCAWAVRNFCSTNYSLYYGNPFLHMPVTNIDQNSVIQGGSEALIKTLLEVDKDYNPEHICVFDTCSTALIADDIQTAISNTQKDCRAKIDYIPSAGFTSIPLGKSIEEIAVKYADMMETPSEVLENTVNILGQYKEQQNSSPVKCQGKRDGSGGGCGKGRGKYPDDASELTRMVESIGLKIHRILISGNYDYIKSAPQAAVNVISCPTWGLPLAEKMKEKFNTPYLRHSIPIGIEPTSKWIRDLANFTGRQTEAEDFISKEISELQEIFDKTKNLVKGKAALIECGRNSQTAFARPMALARALQELGMTPYLFGLHPVELKAKEVDAGYFLWDSFDPLILSGNYVYQQPVDITEVVKSLDLAEGEYVYFTQDVFPMAKAGNIDPENIPRVETGVHLRRVINSPGRGVGFRGAKALYENIIEAIMFSIGNKKATLYGRVHGKFYEFD
jgi:nitrogenase molybdenum-iron protein alpha/beta subunit